MAEQTLLQAVPGDQINQSINQTGFLIHTGAGTHPKSGPCQRLGSAQRGAPVNGRLQLRVGSNRQFLTEDLHASQS